jgi:Tol biopolymer transport system component
MEGEGGENVSTSATRSRGMRAVPLGAVLAVAVSCVSVLLASEKSAEASFPGKNGRIAFTGHPDGDSEILKIRPDGSGLKQITHNTVDDFEPAWSPDGSKIAFAQGLDIWVMNADGTNLQNLTRDGSDTLDARPSWAPDGSKIAFERRSKSVDPMTEAKSGV